MQSRSNNNHQDKEQQQHVHVVGRRGAISMWRVDSDKLTDAQLAELLRRFGKRRVGVITRLRFWFWSRLHLGGCPHPGDVVFFNPQNGVTQCDACGRILNNLNDKTRDKNN